MCTSRGWIVQVATSISPPVGCWRAFEIPLVNLGTLDYSFSCRHGQGEFGKSFGDNKAFSVDGCGRICASRRGCLAFDVAKQVACRRGDSHERCALRQAGNSCRLYRKNAPRLSSPGDGARQYCEGVQPGRGALVHTWNLDGGVAERLFHTNVAKYYLERRKHQDYETPVFRHAKTWVHLDVDLICDQRPFGLLVATARTSPCSGLGAAHVIAGTEGSLGGAVARGGVSQPLFHM